MISIQQTGYDLTGLTDILSKQSEYKIRLDSFSIDDDIQSIKTKLEKPYNKTDRNNLLKINKYLQELKRRAIRDGGIKLEWKFSKSGIYCSPIEILNFKQYGIISTDYIELCNKHILKISYNDVYELIAYELMYRDINNETHSDMENKLSNIGITTVVPCIEVLKYLDGDSAVSMSQYMKIGDSSYASEDGKLSWDYYYSVANDLGSFTSGRYKESVDRSFSITHMILVKETLVNLTKHKIQAQLCAVNTDGIYLLMDNEDVDKIKEPSNKFKFDNVVVRAFGRKFEVEPLVSII